MSYLGIITQLKLNGMVNIVLIIFCLIAENNMSENEVADLVNEMFPEDSYYKVIKCENLVINSSGVKFNIELRVNVNDKAAKVL